jgi:hypothetical protein
MKWHTLQAESGLIGSEPHHQGNLGADLLLRPGAGSIWLSGQGALNAAPGLSCVPRHSTIVAVASFMPVTSTGMP